MDQHQLRPIVEHALRRLVDIDVHLLEQDMSERCIAARFALHLQRLLRYWVVDVEYNRVGDAQTPKRLLLPEECLNRRDNDGRALVVPDLIVHRRGPAGPNLLVAEIKKTSNPEPRDCDHRRVQAFREHLHYRHGLIVLVHTRPGDVPRAVISHWYD